MATICPVICYPVDLRLLYSATLLNDTTIACVKADRIIEILPCLKGEDGNSSRMHSSNRCCIPSQILIWCKGDHLVDWIVIYTGSKFLNYLDKKFLTEGLGEHKSSRYVVKLDVAGLLPLYSWSVLIHFARSVLKKCIFDTQFMFQIIRD